VAKGLKNNPDLIRRSGLNLEAEFGRTPRAEGARLGARRILVEISVDVEGEVVFGGP
jgi:hypothetical protein